MNEQESKVEGRRRHNPATRYSNSRHKPCVWESYKVKDSEVGKYVREDITYPSDTQWDWSRIFDAVRDDEGVTRLMPKKNNRLRGLDKPFDTLLDDWEEGLKAFADRHDAQIERFPLTSGRFEYEVYRKYINSDGDRDKEVLFTFTSPKSIYVRRRRKKFNKRTKA